MPTAPSDAGTDVSTTSADDADAGEAAGCTGVCEVVNGSVDCRSGSCELTCDPGFDDCDGRLESGCETTVTQNPLHCGGCDVLCTPGAEVCNVSQCEPSQCEFGRGDCDGDIDTGCETNLMSNHEHCGFCGRGCEVENAVAQCVDGSCRIDTCNPGFGDCDGNGDTGCEAAFATDTANCGRCGHACTNAHGTTRCEGGACVPTCSPGWDDCDGDPDNGCETDLNSADNCGSCGRTCSDAAGGGTPFCDSGTCVAACSDLSGIYALKLTVATSWPLSTHVAPGSGTFQYWATMNLTQQGTALDGTVSLCGGTIPDFWMVVRTERYGTSFADSVFDAPLPAVNVSGTLGGSVPGAALTTSRSALLAGIALPDPVESSWPSLASANTPDHDLDGRPGVTVNYRSGVGYTLPPVDSLGTMRATDGYLATRIVFSLDGSLTSCSSAAGSASVPDIDVHMVGCRLIGGLPCLSYQTEHIDEETPDYQVQSASYSMVRLGTPGQTFSCAQVRAALP